MPRLVARRSGGLLAAALAIVTLVSYPSAARADTIVFSTDYQPNVVNLWSNVPFPVPTGGAAGFNVAGWGAVFNPANPNFIQIQRPAGYGALAVAPPQPGWLTWGQTFNGTTTTNPAWRMDWQEVYFDTATNQVVQGFAGRVQGSAGGLVIGTYGATPGLGPTLAGGAPAFLGPTPEPATILILGAGLGLAALARRRRSAG